MAEIEEEKTNSLDD